MIKKIFIIILFLGFLFSPGAFPQVLTSMGGERVTYEEMMDNEKALIFTWTTWCFHCRRELLRLSEEKVVLPDGVAFYSVNIAETPGTINRFSRRIGLNDRFKNKTILDTRGVVAENLSIFSIPTYIFIKNGKLAARTSVLEQEMIDSFFGTD